MLVSLSLLHSHLTPHTHRPPGVLSIGSSALGEPSWSYVADAQVGLSVIDRFTHFTLQFLERVNAASTATLAQLMDSCAPACVCVCVCGGCSMR